MDICIHTYIHKQSRQKNLMLIILHCHSRVKREKKYKKNENKVRKGYNFNDSKRALMC